MPVDARRDLQGQRLHDLVARLAAAPSDYWRAKLDVLDGEAIRSVADLHALPFTVKSEFRDTYPFGMLTMPLADTVRVHASSGTSGKPTVVAYTSDDVAVFAEVNARALVCAGATPADVVHVAYGYGLFTGGLGLHFGVERLGATAVPASGGNVGLQLQLLEDLGAAGICCTPSFALLLAERAAQSGLRLPALRYGVLGAEPWSASFRDKVEAAWSEVTGGSFDACDIYGLSEIIGPGVAMECWEAKRDRTAAQTPAGEGGRHEGLHVFDDHFLPEVIDPASGAPLPPGERGELVLTTLTKQAVPVLRYRTGDVTRLLEGVCPCGRTHPRIARLEGRVDDMLVIRGVNVFPREIEAVLLEDPAIGGTYAIVIDRRAALPELEVRAEVASTEEIHRIPELTAALRAQLLERLRLRVEVALGEPGSVPRQETGKAKRLFERTDDADPVAT